jgi:hypothetical protein
VLYQAEPYQTLSGSAGLKKFVSATAVADYGDSQALLRTSGPGFEVGSVRLVNRSGSLATVGVGVRYRIDSWVAGQVTAAGAYTDATTAAQDATAGDFVLWQLGIATGNGFLVGASERFNTVSLIQSVAGDQTTPVLKLEYWNGTAWTDLTAALLVTQALLASGLGEKLLVWGLPADWARGGSGTGVPQTTYNVRVTHTVATGGAANPTASQVFVGQSQLVFPDVANGGQGSFAYNAAVRFSRLGTALYPVFSVAAFGNIVELQYRLYI